MSLLDRLAQRKTEPEGRPRGLSAGLSAASGDDQLFTTKALRKFLASLTSRESPVLLDLGPVVGSNVSFFGETLGCKIFVEDIFADVDRHVTASTLDALPAFLKARFPQETGSVDGILCWDLFDYLDRPAAQALATELSRVLRPDGALLGFFRAAATSKDTNYTKFVVADELNLKHRAYPAARGRQAVLLNRDIIRMFPGLRVTDSFLLLNNLREILFRKPVG
jgi:hypothetical protein